MSYNFQLLHLLHLLLHFHITAYSGHILYTSSYILLYFLFYPFNYHIVLLLLHLLLHFHMFHSYIILHLLDNSYNPPPIVLSYLHILHYIFIHPLHSSYNLLLIPLLHFHISHYIFTHLSRSSYNSLTHLSFSFSIVHIFMHLLDSFYMSPEPLVFHFHSTLMHLVDNLSMFLMLLIFHFHNLRTPNSSDYSTEDNHLLNFMEVMGMSLCYQEFHLDHYRHPMSILLLQRPQFQENISIN